MGFNTEVIRIKSESKYESSFRFAALVWNAPMIRMYSLEEFNYLNDKYSSSYRNGTTLKITNFLFKLSTK